MYASSSVAPVVSIKNVNKVFGENQNQTIALKDVNLDIYPGELALDSSTNLSRIVMIGLNNANRLVDELSTDFIDLSNFFTNEKTLVL